MKSWNLLQPPETSAAIDLEKLYGQKAARRTGRASINEMFETCVPGATDHCAPSTYA
jgi:hypothetical protein